MKKSFVVAAAMLVCSTAALFADGPKTGLGVGLNMGWLGGGGQVQFAIIEDLHIGTQFGLRISGGTDLTVAPYAKYFLGGSSFRPFAIAQFVLSSSTVDSGPNESATTSTTGFLIGGGGQYWFSDRFGMFAQLSVLELPISPSGQNVSFGLLTPSLGVEYFF